MHEVSPSTGTSWHLPADTAPQERLWISFPRNEPRMGRTSSEISRARRAWARVAHTVMDHEPVTVLIDPADRHMLSTYLDPTMPVVVRALDNPVLRLSGPTFTLGQTDGQTGQRRLGMLDGEFNGFGRRPGVGYRLDRNLGAALAELSGADRQLSMLIAEGSAFVPDGEGTVIASETVLLDPARNPGWTRANVEAELARTAGVQHVIWLPGGLSRDAGSRGTGGQVDHLVAFASPTVVLLHWQEDPDHPDHEVSQRALEILQDAVDAWGRPLNIATVSAPHSVNDVHGPLGWSYVSVLPVNDAVLVPAFEDAHDDDAHQLLEAAYPERRILPVPAQEFFQRGVGLRSIALPQPSRRLPV